MPKWSLSPAESCECVFDCKCGLHHNLTPHVQVVSTTTIQGSHMHPCHRNHCYWRFSQIRKVCIFLPFASCQQFRRQDRNNSVTWLLSDWHHLSVDLLAVIQRCPWQQLRWCICTTVSLCAEHGSCAVGRLPRHLHDFRCSGGQVQHGTPLHIWCSLHDYEHRSFDKSG